jgi:hypothetical protein
MEAFPDSLGPAQKRVQAMALLRNNQFQQKMLSLHESAEEETVPQNEALPVGELRQDKSFPVAEQEHTQDVAQARTTLNASTNMSHVEHEKNSTIQILWHSQQISDKLRALMDHLEASPDQETRFFGLDAEWDTEKPNPYSQAPGRKKGKIPLIRIGYRLPGSNVTNALLLQLNRSSSLPDELISFLTNENHVFVGVRVTKDVSDLFEDYGVDRADPANKVKVQELGRYAKRRGVVTDAGRGLAHLSHTVLSVVMPKLNFTRCSTWSNKSLRQDQIQYAADDVIKSLDIFLELQKRPDLTQRIDPALATQNGLVVDLVPPHARGNRDRTQNGYGAAYEVTSRAAICEIVEPGGLVRMPEKINPKIVRGDPATTCRIKVTKVLAPTLRIPNMEFELPHGKARKACLGDFGQAPFELVVPCTMLREEHEEQLSVRTYGGFMSIDYNTRISLRTKPNRKKVPLEAEDAEFLNPEEPMEEFLQTLDSSDEEGNDHADAEEIDEVLHELQQDAREQDLARMLEAVREAEIVWNQTQVENDFNLLYNRELGDVPIQVLDAFSVVQGDIFHAIASRVQKGIQDCIDESIP